MGFLWPGLDKQGHARRLAVWACGLVLLVLGQAAFAAAGGSAMASATRPSAAQKLELSSKQVLILNSYAPGRPGLDAYQATLIGSLVTGGVSPENIHVEYLNHNRVVEPEQRKLQQQFLLRQYQGRPLDLVIAVQQPALNYRIHELKTVAHGAPIFVFNSIGMPVEPSKNRKILQFMDKLDFEGTLDQALALFPATRQVVLTFGVSAADQALKAQLLPLIAADKRKLQFSFTDHLNLDAMYGYLASLPPHTIIISGSVNRDRDNNGIVPFQFTVKAAALANAPMFVLYNTAIGSGVIGGSVMQIERGAARLASQAIDYLAGRMQLTDPVTLVTSPGQAIYDWNQLMRWNVDPALLPPQVELLNRPPQLWEEHRTTVLVTIVVVITMALMIIAMLVQRVRLRQADLHNRASEERYRIERQKVEQELVQHRDHLEELVSERTAALSVAVKLAEQANKAKSAFLANMSHELRTPLNSVIGFSKMMAESSHLPHEDRHNLAIINHSGQHLLNLINDILELSKIEAGRNQLQLADQELEPLLREVLDLVRTKAEQSGTAVQLECTPPLPAVQVDGAKLRQVLSNLLSNAVKFAEGGSVTLVLAWRKRGEDVIELDFAVRDSGIGIAAADLQRIFEPFVQVDPKARQGGTGLGLTIAREFVRLMGGQLAVRSTPGEGAEFSFSVMAGPALAPVPLARAPGTALKQALSVQGTSAPASLGMAELMVMPAGSRTMLMQAVRELDLAKANKILADLNPQHAELAARVQLMLDCYQYQQLWQLLDACTRAAPV